MSIKRLNKELKEIQFEKMFETEIIEDNIFNWESIIIGPEKTPYENGVFKLSINFSDTYPFKPPKVKFLTKIYHPNINKYGSICLDILNKNWSPALTISKLLLSISSLLSDPNPDDPLDVKAAESYLNNREEFNKTARSYVVRFS
jgi:ubiquitin-conjugating enzyme E2 D/E